MPRVSPNAIFPEAAAKVNKTTSGTSCPCDMAAAGDVVVLTVWKKSLLLNCDGFTVFNGKGNLVYRVDNYVASNKGEIVLMDADGKSLLTIRRKRLSLVDSWMVCDGETTTDPRFSVHRHVNFLRSKTLAHVSSGRTTSFCSSPRFSPTSSPPSSPKKDVVYEIEGSYRKRSVSVYNKERRCVAEIRRKEAASGVALGVDVFRLVVTRPYIDADVAMAIVILLDQMFDSSLNRLSY